MAYQIAIVGGSITGCMLAQLLKRNPQVHVSLFERSSSVLGSRGVGITLPLPIIEKVNNLLPDNPCSFYPAHKRFFYRNEVQQNDAIEIWQQTISAAAINWGMLYRTLRHDLDGIYHTDTEVLHIDHGTDKLPSIALAHGSKKTFDLVVCADGYDSLGRKTLYPDYSFNYAGYIGWRGTLALPKPPTVTSLEYHCFDKGHLVSYTIPHQNGALINWVLYSHMSHEDLALFKQMQKSSKQLNKDATEQLFSIADHHLSKEMKGIVRRSSSLFYQTIYDGIAPSVSKDRVVLLGDAAKILRPHLGSGAAEGIRQAFELADTISKTPDLASAISTWTSAEDPQSQHMAKLASHVGNALVTQAPDWSQMNQERMTNWWGSLMMGKLQYFTAPSLTENRMAWQK